MLTLTRQCATVSYSFISTGLVQTIVSLEEKFWKKYALLYKLFVAM